MNASCRVVVCQIGAREHYTLAAALHARGCLAALATDVWAPPDSVPGCIAKALRTHGTPLAERYRTDLATANVLAASPIGLATAALTRWSAPAGWARIMAHNRWFGRTTARALVQDGVFSEVPAVFAYSYGALEILTAARKRGLPTLLGQIDPGPLEDEIVAEVAGRHGLGASTQRPPKSYWRLWREECALAETVVVNSDWSRTLLAEAGIAPEKIVIVPLAFEGRPGRMSARPSLPEVFTSERPLRVLFLGQVNVRKGAVELFEAMNHLAGTPVHLSIVGRIDTALHSRLPRHGAVTVVGPVSRSATAAHYAAADVMILPTHSDGFAITQLEAQAAGLPLIVSPFCGRVVKDGQNGLVLPEVSAAAIAASLNFLAADPARVAAMATHAPAAAASFSPAHAAAALLDCVT